MGVFIISIVGLAIVQYQYLRIGLNLAEVQFNQKIAQSIKSVKSDLFVENELTYLVGVAITKDSSAVPMRLDSVTDASQYFLNAFLSAKLLENGIHADFKYRLYDQDSINYLSTVKKEVRESEKLVFPFVLGGYLPVLSGKSIILELSFNHPNRYFLSQLNGLTIPSFLFLFFIVVVVIWVLRSFYWQRNIITTTNDFINNLTHELKTPVFAIGLATKILEEKATASQSEIINLIRKQNDKLKIHIEKVLQLATLEKKGKVVVLEQIDFYPAIEDLAKDFKAICKIELMNFDSELEVGPYLLNGEAAHLSNAINNLLDNAMKYSTIPAEITLTTRVSNNTLIIEILDKGIGIAKQDIPKLFEKYFRVTSGNLHNVKGYGLGLHYVKQIIKFHRGKIKIESEQGRGTRVIIWLPLLRR